MNARTTPPPVPRKKSNWATPIILPCAFGPLLVLLVAFLSYRISNASAVRRLEAEIKRKGEPLTLADLAATYPPIPDEENGAVLLLELWQKEDPPFWNAFLEGTRPLPERQQSHWDVALPFLGAEAKRVTRTTILHSTNLVASEAFLEKHKEHLKVVRQALLKPGFRLPIVFTNGFNALLPHLHQLRQEAQNFHIEALLATERGDVDGAIAAMESMARAGTALAKEPTLISQLVRIACYGMTLEASERLLSRQRLSKEQLESMSLLLHQLEMPDSLRRALIAERAFLLSIFELSPEDLALAASDESLRSGIITGVLGVTGLKASDRRLMLETMETAITLADLDDAIALEECEKLFSEVGDKARRMPPRIFCAMFLPSLEKATIKIATQEARRQAAIVVVATAQYSLTSNGRLPKDIHDLVPEFLPLLPLDTFDGEPLRYKQLPSGFVVYSVGADRIDDGGKERPPKGRQQNFDITFIVER